MNYIERVKELLSALDYTISACSQDQGLISFLFFRADYIYQLECYSGDWNCTVLWGMAHDDSWDTSQIFKSEGIFIPFTLDALDSISDAALKDYLSEAIARCDAEQEKDNFIRASTDEVLATLHKNDILLF